MTEAIERRPRDIPKDVWVFAKQVAADIAANPGSRVEMTAMLIMQMQGRPRVNKSRDPMDASLDTDWNELAP